MIDYENLDLLTYKKQKNLEKFGRTKSCLRNNNVPCNIYLNNKSEVRFSMFLMDSQTAKPNWTKFWEGELLTPRWSWAGLAFNSNEIFWLISSWNSK